MEFRAVFRGVFLLAVIAATPAYAQTPSTSGFTGSAPCRTCHPDVWLNFYKTAHYKSIAAGNLPPDKSGCEACHGPAEKHLQARGGSSNIRAFSLMNARQAMDACLTCHARDYNRAEIRRSLHTQADVACTSCHSIHRAAVPKALLARNQTNVCYGCHPQVRAQFAMPFKHRVNEGAMQCTDCHNPHGASAPSWRMGVRPAMVHATRDGEQPCLACHTDKRGPFVFEHPGVRADGCEICHSPHGSTNSRMLRRPVVFTLCLECHSGLGRLGRQGDGITLQSPSHNMADPRYQSCTACHVRIHGSNSDSRFLR